MMNGLSLGLSMLLGCLLLSIGFVNLFWGNDPFFGLAICVASTLYFFPVAKKISRMLEPKWWRWILAILAVLILWASLGVGDLEGKLELMRVSFPMPNITGI